MPKKKDVWSDGSGLFDLNNLKSGDKSLLEFKPQNTTNSHIGGVGATKKDEDIWGGIGIIGGSQ